MNLYNLLINMPHFFDPSINKNFVRIFSNYINIYQGHQKDLINSCHDENSIMINENLVCYFPAHVCNGIDDLAEKISNPAIFRSSAVNLSTGNNCNWAQPEPVYFYSDIIKHNFVGDSYVRLLTSLHLQSNTVYHRFY
jgi:hypothetical protein